MLKKIKTSIQDMGAFKLILNLRKNAFKTK